MFLGLGLSDLGGDVGVSHAEFSQAQMNPNCM